MLLENIFDHCIPEPNSGCWLWEKGTSAGYPQIRLEGKRVGVHRIVCENVNGQILKRSEFACHKCDNPLCINPEHLFVGDAKINRQDGDKKRRYQRTDGSFRRSVLTSEQVRMILNDQRSSYQLSADLGVDASTIRKIRQGRHWGHLQ